MSKDIVYNGQSFLNKVVENTGSVENAFEMALLNGISITDDLIVGETIKASKKTNTRQTSFFDETNKPATDLNFEQKQSVQNYGIGTMIIKTSFIVG